MFDWKFEGEIFKLEQYLAGKDWASSHSQLPTAFLLDDQVGIARIYFAARDKHQHSRVGYFDINLQNNQVTNVSDSPVLDIGPIGHFDQHGTYPASIVKKDNDFYLFYIGWTSAEPKPLFYSSIGCAVSSDLTSFKKISKGPILDRSDHDPCLVTSPFIILDQETYFMGYVSGDEWFEQDGVLSSKYNIKLAKSIDLKNWKREGKILINYQNNETNIARPSIIRMNDEYWMWYSFIGSNKKYRMGFATSSNLEDWKRLDHVMENFPMIENLNNEMSCYPSVLKFQNKIYMFFNGNSYGKSGVLLAKAESSGSL